jgi:hypothetical protein
MIWIILLLVRFYADPPSINDLPKPKDPVLFPFDEYYPMDRKECFGKENYSRGFVNGFSFINSAFYNNENGGIEFLGAGDGLQKYIRIYVGKVQKGRIELYTQKYSGDLENVHFSKMNGDVSYGKYDIIKGMKNFIEFTEKDSINKTISGIFEVHFKQGTEEVHFTDCEFIMKYRDE